MSSVQERDVVISDLFSDSDGRDDFYDTISDGEFSEADFEETLDTYATRTARGLSAPCDVERRPDSDVRPFSGHDSYLSDFEREHFHPLNVTPERPCTVFFRANEQFSTKDIFDSFIRDGIPASAVRCLQRKPTEEILVTFSKTDYAERFLQHSTFIVRRSRYATYPASGDLTYLTIYDAPYELPDTAIEERLKPYCKVFSRRRGKLYGYPDICNGLRHYRVQLTRSVPCYLRFGKFQLRFYHDGQTKTCRRCGSAGHLARDCPNEFCFNCDTIGHMAKSCPEEMRCCICKSNGHKAIDCPHSWYRRPTVHSGSPASENLEESAPIDEDPPAVNEEIPPVSVGLPSSGATPVENQPNTDDLDEIDSPVLNDTVASGATVPSAGL